MSCNKPSLPTAARYGTHAVVLTGSELTPITSQQSHIDLLQCQGWFSLPLNRQSRLLVLGKSHEKDVFVSVRSPELVVADNSSSYLSRSCQGRSDGGGYRYLYPTPPPQKKNFYTPKQISGYAPGSCWQQNEGYQTQY